MSFRFYNNKGDVIFKKKLPKKKCSGIQYDGSRCRNTTQEVQPYCKECIPRYYNVQIRKSTIPEAGLGLFAYNPKLEDNDIVFRKDDYIGPYHGEVITEEEMVKRYQKTQEDIVVNCPYLICTSDGTLVDGAIIRGPIIYANDGKEKKKCNAIFIDEGGKVHAIATKTIRQNEEIFIHYGKDYWKGVHCKCETVYEE